MAGTRWTCYKTSRAHLVWLMFLLGPYGESFLAIVDGARMNAIEPGVHSFIIKVWLEELIEETGQVEWHGHITHVPSGQREYLRELEDTVVFIRSCLESPGIRLHVP